LTTAAWPAVGQQWLQPVPLLVRQIMAIKHSPGLPHPPTMI
jgi:hypothetical protein